MAAHIGIGGRLKEMKRVIELLEKRLALLGDYRNKTDEMLAAEPEAIEPLMEHREGIVDALKGLDEQLKPLRIHPQVEQAIRTGTEPRPQSDPMLGEINRLSAETNRMILLLEVADQKLLDRLTLLKSQTLEQLKTSNQERQKIELFQSHARTENGGGMDYRG